MKKLIKYFLILQVALISFVSCSNEDNDAPQNGIPKLENLVDITTSEYISIAFDNPKEYTESEAKTIAQNFILASSEKVNRNSLETKTNNIQLQTRSKYYTNNTYTTKTKSDNKSQKAINVPIYEFDIVGGSDSDNKGIVVVSGDERAPKVIAYIPSYNENSEATASATYLTELSKTTLIDDISYIEKLKDSLRTSTLDKIANKLNLDKDKISYNDIKNYISVDSEPISKAKPIQVPPSVVLSYVMSMCTTQWNQTSPYNYLLPSGKVEGYTNPTNYYAGCGVIAVAQIVAFLEPTITTNNVTINWKLLKEYPYISYYDSEQKKNMIGYFIKKMYEETKATPVFNSAGYSNGTLTYDTNLEKVIKSYSTCSSKQSWNPDVVRNSLLANRPVLVMGQGTRTNGEKVGHAFIVDGYLMCQMYTGTKSMSVESASKELVKIYDIYFRANLGWGGYSDGYFLLNKDASVDFEAGGTTYRSKDLSIVANIRKK